MLTETNLLTPTDEELNLQASRLLDACKLLSLTLGTAESLTCGMIAATLGNISGASAVFRGGVVSYQSEIKHLLLNVDESYTRTDNVVNEPTARQMVLGAVNALRCGFAVSATGYAGPSGGDSENPVGTVFIGTGTGEHVTVHRYLFTGDRTAVRRKSVAAALIQAQEEIAEIARHQQDRKNAHTAGIRIRV